MTKRAKIAVVVPTFRRPDRLRRLIEALSAQTLEPQRWEVVVVDDCSCDAAVDDVLSELRGLVPCAARALRTTRNGGPAVARNVGWRSTDAPIVAFIDDDVIPGPEWLEGGLGEFTDQRVGVVQGHTSLPQGVEVEDLPQWALWRSIDAAGPYFEGCNIFYRRDALEGSGGFDEAIAWWGEDTALGWQVVEHGWRSSFCAAAFAVHDVVERGPSWFVRNGWWEQHLVALAARHPGFRRDAFWRPWAYRRRDAAFVLALVAGTIGLRWRPAWFGVLPYVWLGRPSIRKPHFVRRCIETLAVDAARSAGHLVGAARSRVLVV
jgi:cellulose synthase/poly-beta-1,6-N-acetylglucosamine synthase-like glycosyltransferase